LLEDAVCVSHCVCVAICMSVNQGGTNRNHCTQRLVILLALLMNPDCTPKLGQSGLLYGSKSPAEKCGRDRQFSSQLSLLESQPIGRL